MLFLIIAGGTVNNKEFFLMADVMNGEMLKFRGYLFTDEFMIVKEFVRVSALPDDALGWTRGVKRTLVVVDGADDVEGMMEQCRNSGAFMAAEQAGTADDFDFGYHIGLCEGTCDEGLWEGIVMSSRFGQLVNCLVRVFDHPTPLVSWKQYKAFLKSKGYLQ